MPASAPDVSAAGAGTTAARAQNRDSLFMQASVRPVGPAGVGPSVTVRVRNLSAGGLMAEGAVCVEKGQAILVDLANVGPVEAQVAWVGGSRFGVAFAAPVDPQAVRRKVIIPREREVDPFDKPGLRGRPALRPR